MGYEIVKCRVKRESIIAPKVLFRSFMTRKSMRFEMLGRVNDDAKDNEFVG
jgi:hypothetical protein